MNGGYYKLVKWTLRNSVILKVYLKDTAFILNKYHFDRCRHYWVIRVPKTADRQMDGWTDNFSASYSRFSNTHGTCMWLTMLSKSRIEMDSEMTDTMEVATDSSSKGGPFCYLLIGMMWNFDQRINIVMPMGCHDYLFQHQSQITSQLQY